MTFTVPKSAMAAMEKLMKAAEGVDPFDVLLALDMMRPAVESQAARAGDSDAVSET